MTTRPALTWLAAGVLTLALAACTTNATTATTKDDVAAVPATTTAAAAAAGSCTSDYEAGSWSIDLILQNQTGQLLTLDPTYTNRSGTGHWAMQPPATIAPGGCAVINGYSDNPLGNFWITGTYTLPDGTYAPLSCGNQAAFGSGPSCNEYALTTMTSAIDPTSLSNAPLSSVSQKWAVQISSSTGTFHLHWTLTVAASPSH